MPRIAPPLTTQKTEFVNALLNHHSLTELKSLLGDDLYAITEMYAQQVLGDVSRLGALLDSHDADATRQTAHAIKGSSANLGAQELARLAGLVEQGVLRNEADQARSAFGHMDQVARQTLHAMSEGGFLRHPV